MNPIVALGISLAFLVVLVRIRCDLGLAMIAGAVLLGFLSRLGIPGIARSLFAAWTNGTTADLAASLLSILYLENILRNNGYLQKVLASMQKLMGDARPIAASCAAFLGLLPSAGGALFSAPMVEAAAGDTALTPEDKSLINYWYRHVWEYFLPLYSGVILAARIVEVPVQRFALHMLPFGAAAVLIGLPACFRGIGRCGGAAAGRDFRRGAQVREMLLGMAPVLLVISAVLILQAPVWLAVATVIILLAIRHRYRPAQIVRLLKEGFSLRIILLVAGVMAFRGLLMDAGIVEALPGLFAGIGLPPAALVVLLPLTVGLLVGITVGAVGASFPLLLVFLGTGAEARMGSVVLAYMAGNAGVMLSPVHLCLILTVQFFQARMGRVWRRVLPPVLANLALAILYYLAFCR